jgi:hypothetical protein
MCVAHGMSRRFMQDGLLGISGRFLSCTDVLYAKEL